MGHPLSRSKGGFTLIEMVIVVLVLGILASLAAPTLREAEVRAAASAGAQAINKLETAVQLAVAERGWGGFGTSTATVGANFAKADPAKVQAELEALGLAKYVTPADLDLGWGTLFLQFTPELQSARQVRPGLVAIVISPLRQGSGFNPLGEAAVKAMGGILSKPYRVVGGSRTGVLGRLPITQAEYGYYPRSSPSSTSTP